MTDPFSLPRDEDVEEFEIGNKHVSVVRLTDENRPAMLEVVLSMYLGESCKYCLRIYETLDDLKITVWAGYHEHGRLACKDCWNAHNPEPRRSNGNRR